MMNIQKEMAVLLMMVIQRTRRHVLCAMNIFLHTVNKNIKLCVKISRSAQIV